MTQENIVNPTEIQNRNVFGRFVYSTPVQNFIIACIVINSIQLGLDTTEWWTSTAGGFSKILDQVLIWIFAVEIILKLISDRHRFFYSGWNIFDFLVVAIAFVPGNGAFSVLRVFRIFRALRLLYRIPRLRIITESLFKSIPSIGWICVLLGIWFYIASVISTSLFGTKFPEWFGTIAKSMYTLFQVMTLESWSMGIVRPVMAEFPYAWLLFLPFIIFATYTVMNLFIGIMVNSISEIQNEMQRENAANSKDSSEMILQELQHLQSELRDLKAENSAMKTSLEQLTAKKKS